MRFFRQKATFRQNVCQDSPLAFWKRWVTQPKWAISVFGLKKFCLKNVVGILHLRVTSSEAEKKMLLPPLLWRCAECAVHHERNVREEQHYIYVARTSNNRVIAARELYCCLLPQCEVLRACRSGFPIAILQRVVSFFISTYTRRLQLLHSS